MGIRMHIGLGGLSEENLMVILDSHRGAVRDAVLLTKAMVGESNLNRVFPDENNLSFHNDDLIRLECDYINGGMFGMEIFYLALR